MKKPRLLDLVCSYLYCEVARLHIQHLDAVVGSWCSNPSSQLLRRSSRSVWKDLIDWKDQLASGDVEQGVVDWDAVLKLILSFFTLSDACSLIKYGELAEVKPKTQTKLKHIAVHDHRNVPGTRSYTNQQRH